jgi:hypothetical protein
MINMCSIYNRFKKNCVHALEFVFYPVACLLQVSRRQRIFHNDHCVHTIYNGQTQIEPDKDGKLQSYDGFKSR